MSLGDRQDVGLQVLADHVPWLIRGIGDAADYARRVEAVNFALSHDDGLGLRSLGQADLILVGVSRSGKTPTSLYLALQFGMKVPGQGFRVKDVNMDFHYADLTDANVPEAYERLLLDACSVREEAPEERPVICERVS